MSKLTICTIKYYNSRDTRGPTCQVSERRQGYHTSDEQASNYTVSLLNLTTSCFMNRNGALEGIGTSTKKDQELVADISAGNNINVKDGQGQTLFAQLETEKNIVEQMTQRHTVLVWSDTSGCFIFSLKYLKPYYQHH